VGFERLSQPTEPAPGDEADQRVHAIGGRELRG
jgi:hypothetical protein